MHPDLRCGEPATQSHLVDMLLLHLFVHFGHELVTHLHQLLVATTRIHVEMEVTAIHHSMCRVTTGQHIQYDIVRTVLLGLVCHSDIRSHALYLVEVVHIGSHIKMTAHRYRHRFLGQMQFVEVDMQHISGYRSLDILFVRKGIQGELTLQQRIVRIDIRPHPTVLHRGRGIHTIKVVLSILELLDASLGLQVGLG